MMNCRGRRRRKRGGRRKGEGQSMTIHGLTGEKGDNAFLLQENYNILSILRGLERRRKKGKGNGGLIAVIPLDLDLSCFLTSRGENPLLN